ncbi:MAG: hypothetical protein SCH71_16015 [Desulfobulbaceae bacterium]|nr:hypothetical protein [Desulfobulbaceae bacterium]
MNKPIRDTALKYFREWLASQNGYICLIRTAGLVFKESSRHAGLEFVFPYDLHSNLSRSVRQEITEELAHDFLVFLLDEFALEIARKPSLLQDLVTGRPHLVLQQGWHLFLGRWKEKSRSKEHNPRGYLYRRVREMVSGSDHFVTSGPGAGWIAYAPSSPCPPSKKVWEGRDVSFSGWPAPENNWRKSGEKEIFTIGFLLPAALFFHGEVTSFMKENVYVPVREFVRYLSSHFPWINKSIESELFEDAHLRNELNGSNRQTEMEKHLYNRSYLSSVSALVDLLMVDLTIEQCSVLALKLENPSITFKSIARQLDYPDHNSVYRLYNRATATIRRYQENLPGSPPEELPENVKMYFLEELISRCKKRLACP